MEFGEVDLDTILKRRIDSEHPKSDPRFTQFYWKEMLECVAAVHRHDVVHSDLKPANFLLVKGSLKLIDFGIANVIQDDTINVHREHQVGTPQLYGAGNAYLCKRRYHAAHWRRQGSEVRQTE
jgi:serine/threonine-protein kinase TTK/MPS1